MKKFFASIITVPVMCMVLFSACQKHEPLNPSTTETPSKFNVSTDGNVLKFRTAGDYQSVVENQSASDRKEFISHIQKLGYVTYGQKYSNNKLAENKIDDDFLLQILNQDAVVQIGEYLYKIYKPQEQVFVLPAKFLSEYQDLITQNTKNPHIRQFSTAQDVIELVEHGGNKALFCNEDGVGSRSQSTSQPSNSTADGVKTTLRHSKFGVYFTLVAESYTNPAWPLSYFVFEFSSNSDERRFKRRCESMEYVSTPWNSILGVTDAKYKFKESLKNFSKYHIRMRCKYYITDAFLSQTTLISTSAQWLEIRVNL